MSIRFMDVAKIFVEQWLSSEVLMLTSKQSVSVKIHQIFSNFNKISKFLGPNPNQFVK